MMKINYKFILSVGIIACFVYFYFHYGDYKYIKNIEFITQAPYQTIQDWNKNKTSCEEAVILLYLGYLNGYKYSGNFNKFEKDISILKSIQNKIFGKEIDITPENISELIGNYDKKISVDIIDKLDERKITKFLSQGIPVLLPVNMVYLKNSYYNWRGYHTILIVGENRYNYITKDVGTKYGDDYEYDKNMLLKASKDYLFKGITLKY